MVESLDSWDPLNKHNRLKRIEIWRSEVNTSSIYCACSAPSRQAKGSYPREGFSTTLGKGAGSMLKGVGKLTKTVNQLLREDDTFLSPSLEPREVRSSSLRRHAVYPVCPECGFPTDGVVYKRISSDEFGLVRTRGDLPESVSKARSVDEGEGKRKILLRKVSQIFQRTKALEPSRMPSELIDLSDVANGTQDASTAPKAAPNQRDSGRMTGTEMYHGDVRAGATDDDGEGGLVTIISNDSRKKPRVGIAESVARLRRARKLLDKGVQTNE
ncbi:hypothetical protein F4782DRAFT_276309 [Xylaria castorea]|nr:hypothetical protein F4782DRAFT_276309 [Xylaria castorea]